MTTREGLMPINVEGRRQKDTLRADLMLALPIWSLIGQHVLASFGENLIEKISIGSPIVHASKKEERAFNELEFTAENYPILRHNPYLTTFASFSPYGLVVSKDIFRISEKQRRQSLWYAIAQAHYLEPQPVEKVDAVKVTDAVDSLLPNTLVDKNEGYDISVMRQGFHTQIYYDGRPIGTILTPTKAEGDAMDAYFGYKIPHNIVFNEDASNFRNVNLLRVIKDLNEIYPRMVMVLTAHLAALSSVVAPERTRPEDIIGEFNRNMLASVRPYDVATPGEKPNLFMFDQGDTMLGFPVALFPLLRDALRADIDWRETLEEFRSGNIATVRETINGIYNALSKIDKKVQKRDRTNIVLSMMVSDLVQDGPVFNFMRDATKMGKVLTTYKPPGD